MSISTAIGQAQMDWKERLDPDSMQALDERLGIMACTITMPSGKKRPVLYWNELSFPLTFEIIDKLAEWKKAQQEGKAA